MTASASLLAVLAAWLAPSPQLAAPDLRILRVSASDAGRYNLVLPTAGNDIRISAVVENSTSESVPDAMLLCWRSATPGAPRQAQQTARTGPLTGRSTKVVAVTIHGPGSAGPEQIGCEIDPGNQIKESSESNNEKFETIEVAPSAPAGFPVAFGDIRVVTDGYGWFLTASLTGPERGVAWGDGPEKARWQAECVVVQMPWVRVRSRTYRSEYPGDYLAKEARQNRLATFLLSPIHQTGFPEAHRLPNTLQLSCKVTVGVFRNRMPLNHLGDQMPSLDHMAVQTWWSGNVMLSFHNPAR